MLAPVVADLKRMSLQSAFTLPRSTRAFVFTTKDMACVGTEVRVIFFLKDHVDASLSGSYLHTLSTNSLFGAQPLIT